MDFCQLPVVVVVVFFRFLFCFALFFVSLVACFFCFCLFWFFFVVVLFCFACLFVCLFCFCFVCFWFSFFFFFRSGLNPSCLSKFNRCSAGVNDCSNGSNFPALTCCNQNKHAKLVRLLFSFALTRS